MTKKALALLFLTMNCAIAAGTNPVPNAAISGSSTLSGTLRHNNSLQTGTTTISGNTAITGTLTLPSIIIPLIADDEATLLSATNLVTNAAYYAEDTGKLVVSGSGGVPSVVNSGTASALASGTSDSQITWTQQQLFNNIVITSVQGITAPDALNISSDSDATFYNTASGAGFIATAANMFFSDNAGNSITFADGNLEMGSGVTLQGHTLATGTDAIVTRTGTAAKADSLVTGGTSTGVVLASATYTGAMTMNTGTLTLATTAIASGSAGTGWRKAFGVQCVVLDQDKSVTSSTASAIALTGTAASPYALANVAFPVGASEVISFRFTTATTLASGTRNEQYTMTIPSGATGWWKLHSAGAGGTTATYTYGASIANSIASLFSSGVSDSVTTIDGVLINGTNAGTVTVNAALNSGTFSPYTLKKGSTLQVFRDMTH